MQPDRRPVMGNGASSSQGGLSAYNQRDIRSSVEGEQHDWQPEQAVASQPETLSLQSTRKSYSCTVATRTIAQYNNTRYRRKY